MKYLRSNYAFLLVKGGQDIMKNLVKLNRYGFLIAMTLIVSACGSSSDSGGAGPVSTDMTANQAASFAEAVTQISTNALGAPELKANIVSDESTLLKATTCNDSGCQINEQIAFTLNCTSGGNMKASGSMTGSISSNGTGVISLQIPISITDWQCHPPHIFNGDPYISITGTFSFVGGSPGTQQHIQISGGFKSETQSCQINLGTDFDTNGGGHTSGTVCGHSVDFTF
jgi:hypothetical protein